MANVLVSIRLSPQLAAALDRAAEHLDLSPSQIVEMLLDGSAICQKELLKARPGGPFPVKINLRLSPEAMHKLRRLTAYTEVRTGEFVYGIAPSYFIRSMLAYFFSSPDALQAVFPNAQSIEEWACLLEEEEEQASRTAQVPWVARSGDPRLGVVIILLPLLVLMIIGIADLFKGPTPRQSPPSPPPPPSSGDGEQKLAGDGGDSSHPSSGEGI